MCLCFSALCQGGDRAESTPRALPPWAIGIWSSLSLSLSLSLSPSPTLSLSHTHTLPLLFPLLLPLLPPLLLLISLFSLFPRSLPSCRCGVSVFFLFIVLKPRVE